MSGGGALKLGPLVARPLPAYDPAPLLRAHRLFGNNRRIIASPLNDRPIQPWGEGLAAMRRAFGLEREGHCLTTEPHRWAWFHEPQITGGFVHFLTEGSRARRLGRAEAFVRAAFHLAGRSADFLDEQRIVDATAAAETPGRRRRTDRYSGGARAGGRLDGWRRDRGQTGRRSQPDTPGRRRRTDRYSGGARAGGRLDGWRRDRGQTGRRPQPDTVEELPSARARPRWLACESLGPADRGAATGLA